MKFSFVKNQKIFFIVSLVVVIASLVTFFVHDFNLDIEFAGGTEIIFQLDGKATGEDEAKIEKLVKGVEGSQFSSIKVANGNEVVVRTKLVDEETDYDALNKEIKAKLTEKFSEAKAVSEKKGTVVYTIPAPEKAEGEATAFDPSSDISAALEGLATVDAVGVTEKGDYEIKYFANSKVNDIREEIEKVVNEAYPFAEGSEMETRRISMSTVSPEVSDSLKKTAVIATAVAILLMLVYIAIRFEGRAAIAAIICLAHDVIIMLLAYNLFGIPVSSTIIAAILTILGYSINATIVVFDRIRENRRNLSSSYTFEDAADSAIKATIWRSINTTLTTLFTIGAIYVMGVTSIKNFALPLIVGIIAGVYSSICLSGNIWVALKKIGKK